MSKTYTDLDMKCFTAMGVFSLPKSAMLQHHGALTHSLSGSWISRWCQFSLAPSDEVPFTQTTYCIKCQSRQSDVFVQMSLLSSVLDPLQNGLTSQPLFFLPRATLILPANAMITLDANPNPS